MKNPYLTVEGCVDRLFEEYKKHPRLIVACDFDSTVFPWKLPEDTDFSDTFNVLHRAAKHKFFIVLFTASALERWQEMIKYMADRGIEVAAVNRNIINLPYGDFGKIYYNILLDDRAALGQSIEILNKLIDRIENE